MEHESRAALGFWLRLFCAMLAILIVAALFAAYLQPDMMVVFGDIMSFCAGLLR